MGDSKHRIFDVSTMRFLEADGDTQDTTCDSASVVSILTEDTSPGEPRRRALRHGEVLRVELEHFLHRRPSEALDDGQLALYLQFRRVSYDTVMDWGTFFYFQQHPCECDAQRRELQQQLHSEVDGPDIFRALRLFRYLLEGHIKEDFYQGLYTQVLCQIRSHPRPPYFADALRDTTTPLVLESTHTEAWQAPNNQQAAADSASIDP